MRNVSFAICFCLTTCLGLIGKLCAEVPKQTATISVKDTQTQIVESTMLTGKIVVPVHLQVGKLELKNGVFRGRYKVTVDTVNVPAPLKVFVLGKNEEGQIVLPAADKKVEDILTQGAKLTGEGFADADKEKRKIVCVIAPATAANPKGSIKLNIDSGSRILEFDSEYILETVDTVALSPKPSEIKTTR